MMPEFSVFLFLFFFFFAMLFWANRKRFDFLTDVPILFHFPFDNIYEYQIKWKGMEKLKMPLTILWNARTRLQGFFYIHC